MGRYICTHSYFVVWDAFSQNDHSDKSKVLLEASTIFSSDLSITKITYKH